MKHLGDSRLKFTTRREGESSIQLTHIKEEAKKICKEYKKNEQVRKEFIFCETTEDIKNAYCTENILFIV